MQFYNDSVTIITILSIVLGCSIMTLKVLFKSKCSNVSLCFGLFEIERKVEFETEITDEIPTSNNTLSRV